MARLAIFASGSGSNFQAIAERLAADGKHTLACLICDKPGAYAIERAAKLGTPAFLVSYRGKERAAAEEIIAERLEQSQADFIALAGYMRIFTPGMTRAWAGRMVNIHPALLPKYPGTHAIERCFESGDPQMGITIHWVDEGTDTGEIILQKSIQRTPEMDLAAAEEAIHALEHRWYPEVIADLLDRFQRRDLKKSQGASTS
jgi:phosphoribosylglycinamide formyltransferase 1